MPWYTCHMAATPSTMFPLGTAAPSFALPDVVRRGNDLPGNLCRRESLAGDLYGPASQICAACEKNYNHLEARVIWHRSGHRGYQCQ